MNHIKQTLLIIFCLCLFQNLSLCSEVNSTDEKYSENIIGSWTEGFQVSPYGISTFGQGGRYEAKIFDNNLKTKLIVSVKGKWWIKDGKLYNVIDSAVPPDFPLKKEPYIDVIADFSNDVLTLIDEDGKKYFKYRVK